MRIGVIGTGNMGTILIESLLDSGAVAPGNFIITNRSLAKADHLKAAFPEIHVETSPEKTAIKADLLFICVKPLDMFPIIQSISPYLAPEKCLVSITSPISVDQLESQVPCSCARMIPSITNRALAGVSLLSFGKSCTDEWEEKVRSLAASISRPVPISNGITRVSSDIVSCGPAFFSYLARRFIEGACAATKIDEETATELTENMLIGLGELLKKGFYTLPALEEKVCVKGGITGEGIKIMEQELGDVFNHLFEATHAKFSHELEKTEEQYEVPYFK
ncbi:late competence protein ComER [Peribacillus kribbensis]|uniref:late competence protein ComER n=1 Tax=Peribacillus kribbensis TaxID=356658 RepID=UPI0003FB5374|nr:late competence protein ComER [Peribacillus kribbensis]